METAKWLWYVFLVYVGNNRSVVEVPNGGLANGAWSNSEGATVVFLRLAFLF